MFDLIIVGASAAGVSAAIYAARRNLRFVLVTGDVGGEVATSGEIENYPGFKHTDGIELTKKFQEQLDYNNVKIEQPVKVESIEQIPDGFRVSGGHVTKPMSWEAKTVIIATGIHPKPLPVPSEEKLRGHGITYCTTCDGPLYKGKVVATVGGGNSALESALFLAEICPKVYLINKNPKFKGDATLIDKVTANPKIEILRSSLTANVLGETQTEGVEYKDASGNKHVLDDVRGVFVHIGQLPNSSFVSSDVTKNAVGEIMVDKQCRTNIPGLFAAGDVTDIPYKQIAIATGEGVKAVLTAVSYLNTLPQSSAKQEHAKEQAGDKA